MAWRGARGALLDRRISFAGWVGAVTIERPMGCIQQPGCHLGGAERAIRFGFVEQLLAVLTPQLRDDVG